jgi:hypothetical protein
LSRIREIGGKKKRTSAAKAVNNSDIYGTAEAVPFLKDRVLTQNLKAALFSTIYGSIKVVLLV